MRGGDFSFSRANYFSVFFNQPPVGVDPRILFNPIKNTLGEEFRDSKEINYFLELSIGNSIASGVYKIRSIGIGLLEKSYESFITDYFEYLFFLVKGSVNISTRNPKKLTFISQILIIDCSPKL